MADEYTNPLEGTGGEVASTVDAIGASASAYIEMLANADPIPDGFDAAEGQTFSDSARGEVAAQAASISAKAAAIPVVVPAVWWNPIPDGYLNE
jgi:hypothetical protein